MSSMALKGKESEERNVGRDLKNESKLSPDLVALLGASLIVLGMIGFHIFPGLIIDDAGGSRVINSFYCSVMTLTT